MKNEPDVIANRLVVRPAWAPPLGPEWMQIVLEERDGFGTGAHPTTRACLEELAAFPALELHALIARRMARPPRVLIASGLLDAGADEVAAAYVAAGLREARRRSDGGWGLLVLVRA